MPDVFSFLTSDFYGLPFYSWILLAVIIGLVVVLLRALKNRKEKYKPLNVDEELKKSYKEAFDKYSTKNKINKKLYYGLEEIGLIGRHIVKNYSNPKEQLNGNREEGYILEVYRGRLKKLKHLANFRPIYFIIDKSSIKENEKEIYVDNTNYSIDNFLGMVVISKTSKEIVKDEAYKLNVKQQMDSMINWLPIQSYLSVQHAQSIDSLDHMAEIEKSKRKEMVSEMTGKEVK